MHRPRKQERSGHEERTSQSRHYCQIALSTFLDDQQSLNVEMLEMCLCFLETLVFYKEDTRELLISCVVNYTVARGRTKKS